MNYLEFSEFDTAGLLCGKGHDVRLSAAWATVVLAQDDSSGGGGGALLLLLLIAFVGGGIALLSAVLQPTRRWDAIDRSKGGWVVVVLLVPLGWIFYLAMVRPALNAVDETRGENEDTTRTNARASGKRQVELQPGMRAIARDGRDLGTIKEVISSIVDVEGAFDEDGTPITRVFRSDLDLEATAQNLSPGPDGQSVVHDLRIDTGDWSTAHLREIRDRLAERGIAHELTDGHLTASARANSAVQTIVDEVLRTMDAS